LGTKRISFAITMRPMPFVLTRNLYARDEVEVSLFTAFLQEKSLKEIYFWAYELHYSGFDVFGVLWRIYYDVYFELNPALEVYLSKKQNEWNNTKNPDVFAWCIKNMKFCKPSSKVFVLRQLAEVSDNKGGTAYRGRPPSWCSDHPKKYHTWLRAISKKDYPNIAHHTYNLSRECDGEVDSMFRELAAYFARNSHVEPNADDYWYARTYKQDDAHYLLSIIIFLLGHSDGNCVGNGDGDERHMLPPLEKDLSLFREFGCDHIEGCPQFNILHERRLYGVNPSIGCFALARHHDVRVTVLNDLNEVDSIWERFVFDTPYWVRRFESLGATYDTVNNRVCFPSDDASEKFYELYGCEPDEQTSEVRDKSLGDIPLCGWRDWYESVFNEPSVVDFDATFRFTLLC